MQLLVCGVSPDGLTMLTTSGENILNGCGEEVVLRGINLDLHYGRVQNDPEAPFLYASEEDMEYLKEIGCNSVRMCLHWKLFLTDAGYDLIDTYLSWCEPRGIYLILDMHRVPPDDITGGRGIWNSLEAQDSLCGIWASIADRYAAHPGIAGYDLVNEPAASDPDIWWDLAQRLADSIRVVDQNHIIFVETPGGRCSGLRLIDDSNTVYSVHCYDPFTVSHAGATWPGDSPVPCNSTYPGNILTGVNWVGWSDEAERLTERTNGWIEWESGEIVIPEEVELVSVKAFASGNTGTVHFDDISITINSRGLPVLNGDMEELSRRRTGIPSNWTFYPDGDFTGSFQESGYRSEGCLEIAGSRGSGSWIQTRAYYIEPLFDVRPGDIVQVKGMILAPHNRGRISLGLDYLTERREYWNSDSLRQRIHDAVRWAESNEVPLYVGEFGSLPGTGIDSRNNLISDWITVMNQEGLHWSYWTFRTQGAPSFGLFYDHSTVDETLSEILSRGFTSI
ncbi:MAG TPA: cellulase family glycosylhydrolase [Candidatus Sabulitectum sp.]|nr:cellulase family glycosylhydrolase [Candidatus Sabulitectum sp.]